MEHSPVLSRVTMSPETVQTGRVVDVKLTLSPDEAVAEMGNGGMPIDSFGILENVMVCEFLSAIVFSKMATLLPAWLAIARSGWPSRLKSPTATERRPPPTA